MHSIVSAFFELVTPSSASKPAKHLECYYNIAPTSAAPVQLRLIRAPEPSPVQTWQTPCGCARVESLLVNSMCYLYGLLKARKPLITLNPPKQLAEGFSYSRLGVVALPHAARRLDERNRCEYR